MMTATPDALRAVTERLENERLMARPVVARLRATLRDAWDSALPESWRTLGFVQEVASSAASLLEQDPQQSRSLAQFAIAVATAVPRDTYPPVAIAYVEGHAWKELGTAHRYLSAYDASLRAFDAARRCFAAHGALVHEHAIVDLAAAVSLCEAARYDEALALITKTAPIFAEYGDQRRLVQSALLRAMINHRRGDLDHARAAYEEALQRAKLHGDAHTLAAIYNNYGSACSELGDLDAAGAALTKARELFLQMAQLGEVARTDMSIARFSMQKGDYADALSILERVRERFRDLGMIDEACFAALDQADALVALGDRAAALTVTDDTLREARAAGLNERAVVALSYLRDLLPKHAQPQTPIRHVRAFLDELRRNPATLFVPLSE